MKQSLIAFAMMSSAFLTSTCLAAGTNTPTNSGPQILGDLNFGVADYGSGYGAKFGYGVGVRVRLIDTLEMGLEYRRAKLASDDASSFTAASYLGNAMYRMPAGSGFFAFGLEAGETSFEVSANLGMLSINMGSESKFAVGPKVSYSIPVSDHYEFGVSVDDLVAFTDSKLNSVNGLVNLSYRY